MIELSYIYRVNPVIAIEDFGERSLALHCEDLWLIELNSTARRVLQSLDGESTLWQVAQEMAAHFQQPIDVIVSDVQEAAAQMIQLGLVDLVAPPITFDERKGECCGTNILPSEP